MILTKEEKKFLFSKIENNKKKLAMKDENELYEILHNDSELSENDVIIVRNSLEYKKRLKDGPNMKKDIFLSVKEKLS